MDTQAKLKRKIEPFQDHYTLSFKEAEKWKKIPKFLR